MARPRVWADGVSVSLLALSVFLGACASATVLRHDAARKAAPRFLYARTDSGLSSKHLEALKQRMQLRMASLNRQLLSKSLVSAPLPPRSPPLRRSIPPPAQSPARSPPRSTPRPPNPRPPPSHPSPYSSPPRHPSLTPPPATPPPIHRPSSPHSPPPSSRIPPRSPPSSPPPRPGPSHPPPAVLLPPRTTSPPPKSPLPAPHSTAPPTPPSLSLVLFGGVEVLGFYYAYVRVGGQNQSLFVDTAGDLTWLQCAGCVGCTRDPNYPSPDPTPVPFDPRRSGAYSPRGCDSTCSQALDKTFTFGCKASVQQCAFNVSFGDGSAASGVLATDTFTLGTGSVNPALTFGCDLQETLGAFSGPVVGPTNGYLGVGAGRFSMVSQLAAGGAIAAAVVSQCLGLGSDATSTPAGHLKLGAPWTPTAKSVTVPMEPTGEVYAVNVTGLAVNGTALALPPGTFSRGPLVLDSGTTYSILPKAAHAALNTTIVQYVGKKLHQMSADEVYLATSDNSGFFSLCYNLTLPSGSLGDPLLYFPHLQLLGAYGAKIPLRPENYLWEFGDFVCLGIQPAGTSALAGVLGAMGMRNLAVTLDVPKRAISFSPFDCVTLQPLN